MKLKTRETGYTFQYKVPSDFLLFVSFLTLIVLNMELCKRSSPSY